MAPWPVETDEDDSRERDYWDEVDDAWSRHKEELPGD